MSNFVLILSFVGQLTVPTVTHTVEGPMNLWDCTQREQEIRSSYISTIGLDRANKELSVLCWPEKK